MDSTLSIITMNCRGLGNAQKRKDVLDYLKLKHDICCLHDTHFISDFEDSIREEWNAGSYVSHNTSSSRGV